MENINIATINEAGIAELINQVKCYYKSAVTDNIGAYRDDIEALESKANQLLFDGEPYGTVEREIGSVFTKSGRPEFITLELAKHFSVDKLQVDDEGCPQGFKNKSIK